MESSKHSEMGYGGMFSVPLKAPPLPDFFASPERLVF